MPIKAVCNSCGKTYSLNEKYAGRRLPCKECGEAFEVPDDEGFGDEDDDFDAPPRRSRPSGAPPARRSPQRQRSKPSAGPAGKKRGKKRKSSNNKGLVIGLSIGGGVIAIGLILFLVFTLFGNSHESLISDAVDTMEDMASTMESIDDAASAKAAGPKLERQAERLAEIVRKGKELEKSDPLTTEEKKALEEKYKDRMREATRRMTKAALKIRQIPEARDAFMEVASKMSEAARDSGGGGGGFPF